MTDKAKIISALVDKFLSWPLPKDFSPDGGITFARTVNGEERKGPWWPIGTNLFTAEQARQMLEYLLADQLTALCAEEAGVQEPVAWLGQWEYLAAEEYRGHKAIETDTPTSQSWATAEVYGCTEGEAVSNFEAVAEGETRNFRLIPLYTAPPSAQSLIDAAREECARVCDRFVRYAILGAGGLEPGDRLAQVSREIRALIGQPLNEAKGG